MLAVSQKQRVAWAAGVFEGEGSVYIRRFVRGKNRTEHLHGGFRVQMTDRDVLERIQEATGVGRINPCEPTGFGSKSSWAWQVQNREAFEHVANLFRPYLSERRRARLTEVERQLTWRSGWWRATA